MFTLQELSGLFFIVFTVILESVRHSKWRRCLVSIAVWTLSVRTFEVFALDEPSQSLASIGVILSSQSSHLVITQCRLLADIYMWISILCVHIDVCVYLVVKSSNFC